MKCPKCNQEILADSQFCPFCGTKIQNLEPETAAPQPLREPEKANPNKKKSVALIVSTVTLLAIAVAGYFLLLPKMNYNKALKAMDEGRWSEARAILETHNYSDGAKLIEECYMHENADYDFLRALETSLGQRITSPDDADLNELVENELSLLDNFSNKTFHNKTVKENALKYIRGVKRQKVSLTKAEDNSGYFISDKIGFDEGRLFRLEAATVLIDEFGLFAADPSKADYCHGYLDVSKAWLEIDKDIMDQLIGSSAEYDEKSDRVYVHYKNRTDYEYDAYFYSLYYYEDRVDMDELHEQGIRPGEEVTLYLDVLAAEKEEFEEWVIEWNAYDIYKDGVYLTESGL